MIRPITCDEVFEVLTRAPFPSGNRQDIDVDRHLAVCYDCRQLAEALRPATDLLCEVMAEEQRETLPSYRGELAAIVRTPRAGEARESQSSDVPLVSLPCRLLARKQVFPGGVVGAVALLVLLMFLLSRGPSMDGFLSADGRKSASFGSQQGECVFVALSLHQRCLPLASKDLGTAVVRRQSGLESPEDGNNWLLARCAPCHATKSDRLKRDVCCTSCHSAQQPNNAHSAPSTNIRRLASSCSACHT